MFIFLSDTSHLGQSNSKRKNPDDGKIHLKYKYNIFIQSLRKSLNVYIKRFQKTSILNLICGVPYDNSSSEEKIFAVLKFVLFIIKIALTALKNLSCMKIVTKLVFIFALF